MGGGTEWNTAQVSYCVHVHLQSYYYIKLWYTSYSVTGGMHVCMYVCGFSMGSC